jgi:ATP-dependent DNA helicase RecG
MADQGWWAWASSLPAEVATALKSLLAEARDGFRDRVVIGGLARFVENLVRGSTEPEVSQLADLLRDYRALDPAQRVERIDQAAQLLGGSLELAARGGVASAPRGDAAGPAAPDRRSIQAEVGQSTMRGPVEPQRPVQPAPQIRIAPAPPGVGLSTPIEALKGIGPVRARLYTRLGLRAVRDLLWHFPTRYIPYPPAEPINDLFFQSEGSVLGTLERLEVENLPRGLKRLRATIRDASGTVYAIWLRHGVARIGVQVGEAIAVSGKLARQGRQLVFENPDYESGDSPAVHTRRLVPVHPLTAGLTDRELRWRIHWALTHFAGGVDDPLPTWLRERHQLLPIDQALRQMHFPSSQLEADQARRRFAFEELLTIQLVVLQRRMLFQHDPAPTLPRHAEALAAFEAGLPFALTAAQRRVTEEILADLQRQQPMTRLLQGEVGSGKTAVAAMALVNALANDHQGALMAPTEILAEQHFATLSRLFDAAGDRLEPIVGRRPSVRLLTGSIKGKERRQAYDATVSGELDVLIGTQALIQDKLEFARLGLVIVDEQHRFGVRQRVTLRHKAADNEATLIPHLLVMTATPIPRTLALSLYGDLDLSAIDEMPPGRQSPRTVLLGSDERQLAYERVRRAATHGQQAFIICPLVEESEALEAKAATEEFERLRNGELKELRLALLHGRMKAAEKDTTMRAFRDGQFDVLVSTAVVEVGVDVPNATVMLIEGAERFGLAQLHQFRGRIGRGDQPSVCVLLSDLPDPQANERLRVVASTTNGLALAEHDLRLRGPGDYFGVRQSGFPELKVARLDDAPLVEAARGAASEILRQDPDLEAAEHQSLRGHLDAFLARAAEPS